MLTALRKADYFELLVLFFIQGAAMAVWFVPLGSILDAHGLHAIKPFAFAVSAVGALVSPLTFGAMADRHVPPARVLRWLAVAAAGSLVLVNTAIHARCNPWLILLTIQILYIFHAPMFSISSTLVLARLQNAQKEFGPIRSMATLGWMAGCMLVSLLNLDASVNAGFLGAAMWLGVALFTCFLPAMEMPKSGEDLTWRQRLGLDALSLLRDRNTRVIFITTTLFSIPLAAFYPYAPTHLRDLGLTHTSMWMSFAQCTEVAVMFGMGWMLLNWPLKWIFGCGLGIGVIRFGLSALNTETGLLFGVFLHGASFALVFVIAQIYLEQRIAASWRARAQALLSLVNGGIGSFVGYLGTGWWMNACMRPAGAHWPIFWGGLAGIAALVLVFFLTSFREQPTITADDARLK